MADEEKEFMHGLSEEEQVLFAAMCDLTSRAGRMLTTMLPDNVGVYVSLFTLATDPLLSQYTDTDRRGMARALRAQAALLDKAADREEAANAVKH